MPISELIFCLWNAISTNGKEHKFDYFFNKNKVNIALVTETASTQYKLQLL